jgi:hypothetical protein
VGPYDRNSFAAPSIVAPHPVAVDAGEEALILELAPHSLTVVFFGRAS